jgi:hypothetical protein
MKLLLPGQLAKGSTNKVQQKISTSGMFVKGADMKALLASIVCFVSTP